MNVGRAESLKRVIEIYEGDTKRSCRLREGLCHGTVKMVPKSLQGGTYRPLSRVYKEDEGGASRSWNDVIKDT